MFTIPNQIEGGQITNLFNDINNLIEYIQGPKSILTTEQKEGRIKKHEKKKRKKKVENEIKSNDEESNQIIIENQNRLNEERRKRILKLLNKSINANALNCEKIDYNSFINNYNKEIITEDDLSIDDCTNKNKKIVF